MAAQSEYDEFVKDDYEFRTITTLLNTLGSRERVTPENFNAVPKMKPYLKFLSALSSLLVREREIVAILPKRSSSGVSLLIGFEESPFDREEDLPSPPPSPSSPPGRRLQHYITRNPRADDELGGGIRLSEQSPVTVGSNVDDFIIKHWNQTFEHHTQAFADLLNVAFKNPGPTTRNALKRYSTFQSAPKIARRFKRCTVLAEFQNVDVSEGMAPTLDSLPPADRGKIAMALYRDKEGQKCHTDLYNYVTSSPGPSTPPSIKIYHQFIVWLISTLVKEIEQLRDLQKPPRAKAPEKLPTLVIKSAILHLEILQYLAWSSDFLNQYIEKVSPPRDSGGLKPSPDNNSDNTSQVAIEPEDDELAGDVWTEFETGEDTTSQQPSMVHPWILELRLITSNIHQLQSLFRRLPLSEPLSFSFQMLQSSKSGNDLKPWRALVHELFPNSDEESEVLRALESLGNNRNQKFSIFRANGPALEFRGQAHCEAVLGCLYTLARMDAATDISWANIPGPVLRAADNSYSLLASSKRCCPICATIISYLHPDHGPPLQALSKHSVIFPCALPIGLPREVRNRLLDTYRGDLKSRLRALKRRAQSSASAVSHQSEPMWDHDTNKEQSQSQQAKDTVLDIMEDWEDMLTEEVKVSWKEVQAKFSPEIVAACWGNMREDFKSELTAPSTVALPLAGTPPATMTSADHKE